MVASCSFDGGHTWNRTTLPFSRCTGGSFERATDPWVSIGPDGTVHIVALALDGSGPAKSMLAARSTDGGRTFSIPIALQADASAQFFMDKETLTAAPNDTRSTDGGVTWEAPRIIAQTGPSFQSIGNQIAVLPGGRLVNVLTAQLAAIVFVRSNDGGITWTQPLQLPEEPGIQAFTPAISAFGGMLAISYYDTRDDAGAPSGLRVARWLATSNDLGHTFADARLSEAFDIETAPTDGGFFLGDYMGLVHAGGAFLPLFVVTSPDHRTDVVFRPADSPPDKAQRKEPVRPLDRVARIVEAHSWPVLGR